MLMDSVANVISGRTVIVTGHTGFKGSWLALWLNKLGANVTGLGLSPDQGEDNLFERADIASACRSVILDIRDHEAVEAILREVRPSVVFHLAAQPLVQRSYQDPIATFATNVMGTAHVLEAARNLDSVEAVVCVTTDKVYENKEWYWPYRESEQLGGRDPYSASKSAAEMIACPYMSVLPSQGGCRIATARGGNVIGGGDWSEARIVPDIVRAVRDGRPLALRYPGATRPWQHVLELCFGYLVLAKRLLNGRPGLGKEPKHFVDAWNFGPDAELEISVGSLVRHMLEVIEKPEHPVEMQKSTLHESTYLRLDSSKARAELGWRPLLDLQTTMTWTAEWYRRYLADPRCARALVENQIEEYLRLCQGLTE
jgi:CDP-glucose 4,6-dehydratase